MTIDRVDHAKTDAVVLVGGKGTRLRPMTLSTPKPMLPTAGVPFVTHLLARIARAGIKHVILSTSYKAEVFSAHFGSGHELGLEIEYVTETTALGTGGGIRNVLPQIRHETVMVFNGDVLGDADLGAVLDTHFSTNADVTMHLVRVSDPRRYGCVITDAAGCVQQFLEKAPDPPTDQINAGCYVFRRSVIESIAPNVEVSVERHVFPSLLAVGTKIVGHVDSSYWRDMGTLGDFVRGSADLVRGIAVSPAVGLRSGEALVHPTANVSAAATLLGGTSIGQFAEIAGGVRLDGAIIFDGARIEPGAVVERSIIGAGALIGPRAQVRDSAVADGAAVGARCELLAGARVWPGVKLPDNGVRFSTDL